MNETAFIKMHGLGNDFVIFDARKSALRMSDADAREIADRRTGIGCDQLIVIEPASAGGDAFMRIRNADGGEVEACGNAVRCVGSLIMDETGASEAVIATLAGPVRTRRLDDGRISADMGPPAADWAAIPLAREMDTLHLDMAEGPLADPVGVGIGNPHAVFFVADAEAVALDELGPKLEVHPLYPKRANIEVAELRGPDLIRVRVWERGAGLTRACGTGACAVLVAAHRRGLSGRQAVVQLDGGALDIEWTAGGNVEMTGPVATSFTGSIGGLARP
ncbi:MAG: diaminopimelate epimerase [Rhodospirillales bacterium]|jgi:diaminopimelate epimerase|nr:diaminopimelate epimerase [Rhodospirillaceae bacterium]MDP6428837.1 diaminopimelate epimerase [Rhodospirillales bacterium]MDP6643972.1 diaminopimelate epimerase [Rhodospirillales bacterium]MDP6841099.1 diaminopimelate epimerase [Rhodospirillales bacterium]|tara:strand:+ start:136 stop:966 length:831 start_codon:yes stop_codon:yes gene_type:complete